MLYDNLKACFDSALLNISIKDIKNLFQENQILKESLKEIKSREIFLKSQLKEAKKNLKTNKWPQEMTEIELLQKEINNSLLELDNQYGKFNFCVYLTLI